MEYSSTAFHFMAEADECCAPNMASPCTNARVHRLRITAPPPLTTESVSVARSIPSDLNNGNRESH